MSIAASICFSLALITVISIVWIAATVHFMEITEL